MSSTPLSVEAIKIEVDDENLQACRICLAWEGKLFNINERGLDQLYVELMGTTLSVWDGFPQHLCGFCRAALLKAQALRARSRRSQELLKQALMHQHFITNDFIRSVDRSANKLTHTLSCYGGKAEVQCYVENDGLQTDEPLIDFILLQDNKNTTDNVIPDNSVKEFDFNADNESVKNDDIPEFNLDDYQVTQDNDLDNINVKTSVIDVAKAISDDLEIVETTERHKTNQTLKKRKISKKNKDEPKSKAKLVRKRKEKKTKVKNSLEMEFDHKEFEKKYDFEVHCLTDEEMAADMEKRKQLDKYLRGSYKCEMCCTSFFSANIYNNHMKVHDPTRGEYECPLCHIRFYYTWKLRVHVETAHRLRFRCGKCGERVRGRSSAVLHAAYHAGTTFPCAHCDKRFLKKTSRSSHMRSAHPAENAAGGACELCGETFTSRTGLKAHKTRTHNKGLLRELKCRKCSIQFQNMEALKRHKELISDSKCNSTISACDQCGEICTDPDDLILHKHTQHAVELYTCKECAKSFTSKGSLDTHTDRVHRHIRPPNAHTKKDYLNWAAVCELCGKRVSCLATLKIHMNRHTGARPFKCELCPKAYMTCNGLNNHRASHTGERKWRCPECPATFLHQSSIYQHRKIHSGERNYQCTVCDKYFTQSGSLYTHVKYVHRKETPPPRKRSKKSS